MSYIQFESAREKDKARQELREARAQLLERAKERAEARAERELQEELSGNKNWMLPALEKKLESANTKSTRKRKKEKKKTKKAKKTKGKHKKRRNSSSSDSADSVATSDTDNSRSDEDENVVASSKKKHSKKSKRKSKTKHKKKRSRSSSDDSDSSGSEIDDENTVCIEREGPPPSDLAKKPSAKRDDWMTDSTALMLKTYTHKRNEPKKPNERQQQIDVYDPARSSLELNPYWKSTGTGLPSFQKPQSDDDDYSDVGSRKRHAQHTKMTRTTTTANSTRSWQKKPTMSSGNGSERTIESRSHQAKESSSSSASSGSEDEQRGAVTQTAEPTMPSSKEFLNDQQINQLAAKALKAEIKGDKQLAAELHAKLESARAARAAFKANGKSNATMHGGHTQKQRISEESHELLSRVDARGNVRPLLQSATRTASTVDPRDLYGGRRAAKRKKRVETHVDGERTRYFADDDRYDIKQMFEREKYASAADSNRQFADLVANHKNSNDDLDDIFTDKVRREVSTADVDKKEVQRAIHEQQRLGAQLENCERCFESAKLDKRLIVSMGEKVYLALPWHFGLQLGHCVLVPTQHVTCATQLDEDAWRELCDFRKALTRMFAAQHKDVVFYEIANKLHRRPHLSIHCIPIPESKAEMAPFYFKKAIEESEHEWCVNKQLVSLRHKSLLAAIPKGLPYFWVHFGMDNGFAHIIEDQERFPANFAQEIIGGMLEMNPKAWRRPQKEQNVIAKVKQFADWWQKFDCTEQ